VDSEAHSGVTDHQFCASLTASDDEDHPMKSLIYVHVLRPLCWLGLLHENRQTRNERLFTKTALWPLTLAFKGNPHLSSVAKH
jgi:hypothetical protein